MADRKRSHFGFWAAAGGLLLPVLYLLSIGVLIRLESRGHLREPLLDVAIVYAAPYNWVCGNLRERFKPVMQAFEQICDN